ncbi:SprT-like family-domain-containing protein [Globomyces pollinis-pini]|nr:SprT-like family-domain-containing protein [Globomyces pollinis-pini]
MLGIEVKYPTLDPTVEIRYLSKLILENVFDDDDQDYFSAEECDCCRNNSKESCLNSTLDYQTIRPIQHKFTKLDVQITQIQPSNNDFDLQELYIKKDGDELHTNYNLLDDLTSNVSVDTKIVTKEPRSVLFQKDHDVSLYRSIDDSVELFNGASHQIPRINNTNSIDDLDINRLSITDQSDIWDFSSASNDDTPVKPIRFTKKIHYKILKDKLLLDRDRLSKKYYTEFNRNVFNNSLPSDMEIAWSKRLNKTAGRTLLIKSRAECKDLYQCKIELATKVVDTEFKLRNTLIHEMCHAAVWIIEHSDIPHGTSFKRWGSLVTKKYPDLKVSTCHQYQINFKYNYVCVNEECALTYGRHSKSINTQVLGCGACSSKLKLI